MVADKKVFDHFDWKDKGFNAPLKSKLLSSMQLKIDRK